MKKLIPAALIAAALAISGCAKGPEETPPPPPEDKEASAQAQADQQVTGDFAQQPGTGGPISDTSNVGLEEVAAGQAGTR